MEQKQIGTLLLIVGIIGAFLALGMDTSVSGIYGRVSNIGLMNDQRNYLLLAAVTVMAGLALLLLGKDDTSALRACPACAEKIQPLAIKCRYCGADVEPLSPREGPSATWLTDADLRNLAEFYHIQEEAGSFIYQGNSYRTLFEAVSAARSNA